MNKSETIYILALVLLHFGMGAYSYSYSLATYDTDFIVFYKSLQEVISLDFKSGVIIGSGFFR